MVAVGLVITFVGLGEKGFRTTELQIIGPGLVGGGVILAIVRIFISTLPSRHSHVSRGGHNEGKTELVLNLRDNEASEGVAVITEFTGK